jgi:hypothetical protein
LKIFNRAILNANKGGAGQIVVTLGSASTDSASLTHHANLKPIIDAAEGKPLLQAGMGRESGEFRRRKWSRNQKTREPIMPDQSAPRCGNTTSDAANLQQAFHCGDMSIDGCSQAACDTTRSFVCQSLAAVMSRNACETASDCDYWRRVQPLHDDEAFPRWLDVASLGRPRVVPHNATPGRPTHVLQVGLHFCRQHTG